jgi:hypothetical protein
MRLTDVDFNTKILPIRQGMKIAIKINRWSNRAIPLSINTTRECSINKVIGLIYRKVWILAGTMAMG